MSAAFSVHPDSMTASSRRVIVLAGEDRVHFLQGLLTQDVSLLAQARIQFAALLSPQGKILHDMFLIAQGEAILIDTPALYAATLMKRLTMYRLRAKVTLAAEALPDALLRPLADTPLLLADPRHPDLPARRYQATAAGIMVSTGEMDAGEQDFFPDSASDFAPDELTALDAGYDLLNAVSFRKGCYVGQEITARMHYKATIRKGFFMVRAAAPLTVGSAVTVAGKPIGSVRRVSGNAGFAFLRFDEALGDVPATVDNQPVTLRAPTWLMPHIEAFLAAGKAPIA